MFSLRLHGAVTFEDCIGSGEYYLRVKYEAIAIKTDHKFFFMSFVLECDKSKLIEQNNRKS